MLTAPAHNGAALCPDSVEYKMSLYLLCVAGSCNSLFTYCNHTRLKSPRPLDLINHSPFITIDISTADYVKFLERNQKCVPKRLIVCYDGTWQASNHANHEIPSNVAKIACAVSKTYVNEQNLQCPQNVYYVAGVATADLFDSKLSGQ